MSESTALMLLRPEPTNPGWLRIQHLVLDSVTSPHSRRAYQRALDDFFRWYGAETRGPFSKAVVQAWRVHLETAGLAPSSINVRLAAIRKLASEAADNGLLAPELATGVARVKGAQRRGVRAGNWLTKQQVQRLLQAPDPETLKGQRDRALLGLLIGCGLRRSELIALEVGHLQQREARWVLVDLLGKGNRVRTVPVPNWVKQWIDGWVEASGVSEGKLFRAVRKGQTLWGEGLTEKVIWWVVREYAEQIGVPHLAPHDLRRTCAKLCRAAGGDLEQIQLLLGHASVQTTERYLGTRQNLIEAVNDRMGIELA
jgi:integrase/recombinase XerD